MFYGVEMFFIIWAIFLSIGWVCRILEDVFQIEKRYASMILFVLGLIAVIGGIVLLIF